GVPANPSTRRRGLAATRPARSDVANGENPHPGGSPTPAPPGSSQPADEPVGQDVAEGDPHRSGPGRSANVPARRARPGRKVLAGSLIALPLTIGLGIWLPGAFPTRGRTSGADGPPRPIQPPSAPPEITVTRPLPEAPGPVKAPDPEPEPAAPEVR